MVAVAVGDAADKGGDDHLRPLAADGQHGIVEHALMAPAGKGFLLRFGEAEVRLRAPKLLHAVDTRLAFSSSLVRISPSASSVSADMAFCPPSPRVSVSSVTRTPRPRLQIRQQSAVLVVRVRNDHHHAGGGPQPLQRLHQSRRAAILGKGSAISLGSGKGMKRKNAAARIAAHCRRSDACPPTQPAKAASAATRSVRSTRFISAVSVQSGSLSGAETSVFHLRRTHKA